MSKNHIVKIQCIRMADLEYKATCSACDFKVEGLSAPEAERASEKYHAEHETEVDQYKMC